MSLPRPYQVTVSGGIGIAGCLLVLAGLFDTMAQSRSVEAREAVADYLSKPPGNSLGLSAGQVIDLWRGTVLVAAGLTATAFVLAIFLFKRHNGARIGFTVVTALLLLAMPALGLLPVLLAIAAVGLWSGPSRDWFAGRAPQPASAKPGHSTLQTPERPPEVSSQVLSQEQPPPSPYPYGSPPPSGQPPVQQPVQQPAEQPGQPQQPMPAPYPYAAPYPQHQPPSPDRRPAAVTWAAWLTWVSSTLAALSMVAIVVVLLAAESDFRDELNQQFDSDPQLRDLGVTVDQVITGMWVGAFVILFWCIAAIVLAVFAYRRKSWARIVLVVSAVASAGFSLVAVLAFAPILTFITSAATVVLLFTPKANAWYSPRQPPGYPQPPVYPPPGYPPQDRNQPW